MLLVSMYIKEDIMNALQMKVQKSLKESKPIKITMQPFAKQMLRVINKSTY